MSSGRCQLTMSTAGKDERHDCSQMEQLKDLTDSQALDLACGMCTWFGHLRIHTFDDQTASPRVSAQQ